MFPFEYLPHSGGWACGLMLNFGTVHAEQLGSVEQRITRLITDQKIPGSNPGRVESIYLFLSCSTHLWPYVTAFKKVISCMKFHVLSGNAIVKVK